MLVTGFRSSPTYPDVEMGTLVLTTCLKSIVTLEKDTCEYLDETLSFILSYSFLLLVLGSKT
jgi:hypothetical protein